MKTKTTETTKTTQTITYNRTIQDDNGMDIVRMTANITTSTPFGNCSMVVLKKDSFDANKDEIKKLYLAFEEEAANTSLEDETKTEESDDKEE